MPIVRVFSSTYLPPSTNSNAQGQQTLYSKKMFERGVEVWRTIQPARLISSAFIPLVCGLIGLPTSFGTDIPRMSYDPALRLRQAALTGLNFPQYQLALYQIDALRKDGKFIGIDGSIPEGQGIVMAHLNECHELLEMVRSLPGFFLTLRGMCRTTFYLQLKQSMDNDEEEELTEDDDGQGQGSSATTESED